eukprot:TRINITY_DN8881_c0_g1_i1.p2 TRINITY_DN8881_c0_g1~~TRINITY_DN8881_c0_g1_i1.p2  ORF type:complete len:105 (+),score=20.93 TRINITY_DN8881_c0_g1_i1:651-965(+)
MHLLMTSFVNGRKEEGKKKRIWLRGDPPIPFLLLFLKTPPQKTTFPYKGFFVLLSPFFSPFFSMRAYETGFWDFVDKRNFGEHFFFFFLPAHEKKKKKKKKQRE